MESHSRILTVVGQAGEFVELRRIIAALKSSSYVAVYFAYPSYALLVEHSRWCEENDIPWFDYNGRRVVVQPNKSSVVEGLPGRSVALQRFIRRDPMSRTGAVIGALLLLVLTPIATAFFFLKRALEVGVRMLREFVVFFRELLNLLTLKRVSTEILNETRPDKILIGYEHLMMPASVILHEARRRSVPVVLVSTAVAHMRSQYEPLKDHPDLQVTTSPVSSLAAWLFPHWILKDGLGRSVLRARPGRIAAMELFGLNRRDPWCPNAECVDLAIADSERTAECWIENGQDKHKIHVLGAAVHDRIFEINAKRDLVWEGVAEKYKFNKSAPLIVCSWPTNQILPWRANSTFANFRELANAWSNVFLEIKREYDVNIWIFAHPKAKNSDLHAARNAGLAIADEEVAIGVALCDLFIGSSTSVAGWALAAGKPVLNYDVNGYEYADFHSAKSAINVKTIDAFRSELHRICSHRAIWQMLKDQQVADASNWGICDGKALMRLKSFMQNKVGMSA